MLLVLMLGCMTYCKESNNTGSLIQQQQAEDSIEEVAFGVYSIQLCLV